MESQLAVAEMIDITPLPHILFGMSAQNLPWWKVLGELVDNSFDAKATRVVIKCGSRTVSVSDDGKGMPDIASAITLGGHKGHGEHSLGRYGVGLKDAWRSAGERIEVLTVRDGVQSYLDFCLASIQLHDRSWKLPRPQTSETQAKPATRITLHLRTGKQKPGSEAWESLAWAFTPALLTGRQIVHGNEKTQKPLAPCKFPTMSETVGDTFEVCGKQVSINVGIMAPGEKIFRGPFWVQYGHRNIVGSAVGCLEYDDEHLAGTITLGDGWKLTKNKDDFDDHKDELAQAINARIRPLLIKAAAISHDVESSALTTAIAGMLNASIAKNKREKRTPTRETSGTVLPAASGKRRRKASQVHDNLLGEVCSNGKSAPRTGFSLGWFADPEGGVGTYDYHANRIKLNQEHEFVKRLKTSKNMLGLYSIAAAILSDHHCTHDGASRLLMDVKEFQPVFSDVTKRIGGVEV